MSQRSEAKRAADRRRHEKIMADPALRESILSARRERAQQRQLNLTGAQLYARRERDRIRTAKYRAKLRGVEYVAPEPREYVAAVPFSPFAELFKVAA
jgi:hypothetical protein